MLCKLPFLSLLLVCITVICLTVTTVVNAQEEIIDEYTNPYYSIQIVRDIRFSSVFMRIRGKMVDGFGLAAYNYIHAYYPTYIEIDSPGGKMEEMFTLGKTVFLWDIPIWVKRGTICSSACGFLLLYADKIKIDGIVSFHTPHKLSYDPEMTLHEIAHNEISSTLYMVELFDILDVTFKFYKTIIQKTSVDTFLVILDGRELAKLRLSSDDDFIDNDIMETVNYQIWSGETLKKAVERQGNMTNAPYLHELPLGDTYEN